MARLEIYCAGCDRPQPVKNFYINHNSLCDTRDHLMLYCKDCCKKISDKIFEQHKNYEFATIQMCNTFYMPFNIDACRKLNEKESQCENIKNFNRVYEYGTCLREANVTKDEWDNLIGNNNIALHIIKSGLNIENGDEELFDNLELEWGKGKTLSDYLFLEQKYQTYMNGETPSPAMKTIIKYLCNAELDVKILKESNAEQKEITVAEKRVMNYYSTLNLDNFKTNASKSEMDKLLETWAFYQEEKEPLDWVDENLEDICKFREDNDEILRAVGNKCANLKDYPTLTMDDIKSKKKKK